MPCGTGGQAPPRSQQGQLVARGLALAQQRFCMPQGLSTFRRGVAADQVGRQRAQSIQVQSDLRQGFGAGLSGGLQHVGQRFQLRGIIGREAFAQDRQGVGASLECAGMQDGRLCQFLQPWPQREQMAGKIATVHGRNVEGGEGL
ncbi:hypothetical protein D3C86_930840 [compost metagenome]